MKKNILFVLLSAVLLSSCGTYTGAGAYTGSMIGAILGGAMGGISGGPRGHDVGTIVGVAGGAVAGAAIGAAADKKQQQALENYEQSRDYAGYNNSGSYNNDTYDYSGYDPSGKGDDRITMTPNNTGTTSSTNTTSATSTTNTSQRTLHISSTPTTTAGSYADAQRKPLEIRNAIFVGGTPNTIHPQEENKIVFEVYNNTNATMYDIRPMVRETSSNSHIFVSPDARVESIPPHRGIRYTAIVKSDKKIRDGQAHFLVSVAQGEGAAQDTEDIVVALVE